MKKIFRFLILLIVLVSFDASVELIEVNAFEVERLDQTPELNTEAKIIFQGQARNFFYYVPADLPSVAVPLVFVLHGYGGSGMHTGVDGTSRGDIKRGWMQLADKNKFIVVYPNGIKNSKGKRAWNDCRGLEENGQQDDVGFFRELIEYISSNFTIDKQKIYATGISNGGHMSIRLAMELSDEIAAVGVIAAAMPDSTVCVEPDNPVSILFMNGTRDKLLPFTGGEMIANRGKVLSTAESVKYWVTFLATSENSIFEKRKDIYPDDGSIVTIDLYKNGFQGSAVALYTILGGGHSSPSIEFPNATTRKIRKLIQRQNRDIECSTEVWNFFRTNTPDK